MDRPRHNAQEGPSTSVKVAWLTFGISIAYLAYAGLAAYNCMAEIDKSAHGLREEPGNNLFFKAFENRYPNIDPVGVIKVAACLPVGKMALTTFTACASSSFAIIRGAAENAAHRLRRD